MTSGVYCPIGQSICLGGCKEPCKRTAKVTPLRQSREDLLALVRAIKQAVHEYDGRISVTEAIGALEIAKIEIYEGQK